VKFEVDIDPPGNAGYEIKYALDPVLFTFACLIFLPFLPEKYMLSFSEDGNQE
jgi:hypothetical protein